MRNNDTTKETLKLYFWTVSYVRNYWVKAVIYLVLTLITSAISLSVPKFVQFFVDHILPEENYAALYNLILILVSIIISMILIQVVVNRIEKHVMENSLYDLRSDLLNQLRKVGYPFFEAYSTGQLLQMFTNEVKAISEIYQRYLPKAINLLFLTIISFIMVINIHPLLALVFVPSILLYNTFGKKFAHKAALYGRETRENHRMLHGKIYTFLSGLVELRISGKTNWIGKEIDEGFQKVSASSNKEMFWLQSRGTARKSIISYGLVVVFVAGTLLVKAGSISVGEFIAFVFYYEMVISRVTTLITNITQQRVLLYQIEKVYEKMQIKPYIPEKPLASTCKFPNLDIEFNRVSLSYSNDVQILSDLNLKIHTGEKVAIVGESGSGKSTLFKLLIRFYDPTKGTIQIGGIPTTELSFKQLRGLVGCVFQETYLFGSTIGENIMFGNPEASNTQMIAAAKAAYVHDYIMSLPEGYNTQVGERGINLSGGQKQRLAIARVFLKNPAIVLMDEATSALDNISEAEVINAIDKLMYGRTIITIAHRLSTIRHYDRIIVLKNGRVIEQGTFEQLMALKQAYYSLETRGLSENVILENSL